MGSTLKRETSPTEGYGPALLPQHEAANGDYVATGENNPLPFSFANARGQVPMQVQEQFAPQEKVASSFSVGAGSTLIAKVVEMDGYAYLHAAAYCTTAHNFTFNAINSPDGATALGSLFTFAGSGMTKQGTTTGSLAYVLLTIQNSDAAGKLYDVYTRKFN